MFTIRRDILHLIYPSICLICDSELSRSEKHICTFCSLELPVTNFSCFNEPSPMDQLFWGRLTNIQTYSHLFFEKGKASQKILFTLKYKNNSSIGTYFGVEIGNVLKLNNSFTLADAIIPIPLHYKKLFARGYNQSEAIANGISEVLNIPIDKSTVKRRAHSQSQTRKSRFQRWDNVESVFSIADKIASYQHIILIDDVITTGSTIESIIHELRKKNAKLFISVVTLAIA